MKALIGQPLARTDGAAKVTGAAVYTTDVRPKGLAHAVMVTSTIANGRIDSIDEERARSAPGVLLVLTHRNAVKLPRGGKAGVSPPQGRVLSLLQDDRVHYNGEPVAVVVADTLEHATHAAQLLRVTYAAERPVLEFDRVKPGAYRPKEGLDPADSDHGDAPGALTRAPVRISATYTTPLETHNPMEPHATVAQWEGDRLTLHDSTQYVSGVRRMVAKTFRIPESGVRVISRFVGGGFGCKGSAWSHVVLAAMAAKRSGRPVKLVLQRPQMFGPVGGRPHTEQRIELGAGRDGRLTAITHDVVSNTSQIEDWVEYSAVATRILYACDNIRTTHRLVKLNLGTPTFQRAPGEASGTFAIESAMDELAYAIDIDPMELRMRNYAESDPESGLPWSSKSLRECYRIGAERFGWSRRNAQPGSMRNGRALIGWGMATATYPMNRMTASASAQLLPDGSAVVRSGTQEIGTGTYTIMTQIAADTLGLAARDVRFELGDTSLPQAPISAGSMTAASVGPAVQAACLALREKIATLAVRDKESALSGAQPKDIAFEDGMLVLRSDPSRRESIACPLSRNGWHAIEARAEARQGDEEQKYAMHSVGAVFAEVRIDPDLRLIHVPRIVGAYGAGRVLNPKTARSQLIGGIVWGIGMALLEESLPDPHNGRIVNANLAEYHVPVNADVGAIDVTFVDEDDPHVNPLGVKGIGEIGITGVAAAIANAVYHATGRRIRHLPITFDKLL